MNAHASAPGAASGDYSNGGSKTIVIKLGTSSILSETTHQPKLSILSSLVETCHTLRLSGHHVVLVCSGAIGMGKVRMGFMSNQGSTSAASGKAGSSGGVNTNIGERQALAAMGQLRLIALWDTLFGELGIRVAQVLLTRSDIADRPRFVNARNTLQTLLSPRFNAIPIVNENDTVSVSELRFGDNDTLSAITAGLIDADYLFLLTDVDGLYTGNPRNDPDARRLGLVDNVAKARRLVNVASQGSNFGTGGMMTKLVAAELATAAGVATVIINGSEPRNIVKVVEKSGMSLSPSATLQNPSSASNLAQNDDDLDDPGVLLSSISSLDVENETSAMLSMPTLDDPPHTMFLPVRNPMKSRKWSILHALHPAGTVIIDEGAFKRISRPESGGRLLAAGVVGVEGIWERMQAVRIMVRRKRQIVVAQGISRMDESPSGSSASTSAGAAPSLVKRLNTYLRPDSPSGNALPPGTSPSGEAFNGHSVITNATHTGTIVCNAENDPTEWELAEVGRGLANYNSIECERIKGLKSSSIVDVLGYVDSDYVVDELALHVIPLEPLR